MEEQNRAGINKTMGCCMQHTRKVLMIMQGLLRQHGKMDHDEVLQDLIDEADDFLSAGVIGNVRGYSDFYHRIVLYLNPLILDLQYPTTSPLFQNAVHQNWTQLAGEFFSQPVIEAPLAADAWNPLPPAKFSAFRRKASRADDCSKCLRPGHSKDKCPNAVVCKTCEREEHISRNCPVGRCTHCGRKGHAKDNCQWIGGLRYVTNVNNLDIFISTILSLFTSSAETSNATEPGVASNALCDPQNEAIDKFMEQNKEYVNKIWDEQEHQLRESTGISNIEEDLLAQDDATSNQIESIHEELAAVLQESVPPIPAPNKRGRKPKLQQPNPSSAPKKRGRPAKKAAVQAINKAVPSSSTPASKKLRTV